MRILLTGATGFVGRDVLARLRDKHTVITLGRSASNDVVADLCDATSLAAALDHVGGTFDMVVHLAGRAHVESPTDDDALFRANRDMAFNLTRALDGRVPRSLVFLSTVAVYGATSGDALDETTQPNPVDGYGKGKLAAEKHLEQWASHRGVRLAVLRASLIVGPDARGTLGAMARGIATGRYRRIGDGSTRRSMLALCDVTPLIMKSAEVGGIYNVCDMRPHAFREIEEVYARASGRRIRTISRQVARVAAWAGDILGRRFPINSRRYGKMTTSLTFSAAKAIDTLGLQPTDAMEYLRSECGVESYADA